MDSNPHTPDLESQLDALLESTSEDARSAEAGSSPDDSSAKAEARAEDDEPHTLDRIDRDLAEGADHAFTQQVEDREDEDGHQGTDASLPSFSDPAAASGHDPGSSTLEEQLDQMLAEPDAPSQSPPPPPEDPPVVAEAPHSTEAQDAQGPQDQEAIGQPEEAGANEQPRSLTPGAAAVAEELDAEDPSAPSASAPNAAEESPPSPADSASDAESPPELSPTDSADTQQDSEADSDLDRPLILQWVLTILTVLNRPLRDSSAHLRNVVGFVGIETCCVGVGLIVYALAGPIGAAIAAGPLLTVLALAFRKLFFVPEEQEES